MVKKYVIFRHGIWTEKGLSKNINENLIFGLTFGLTFESQVSYNVLLKISYKIY